MQADGTRDLSARGSPDYTADCLSGRAVELAVKLTPLHHVALPYPFPDLLLRLEVVLSSFLFTGSWRS